MTSLSLGFATEFGWRSKPSLIRAAGCTCHVKTRAKGQQTLAIKVLPQALARTSRAMGHESMSLDVSPLTSTLPLGLVSNQAPKHLRRPAESGLAAKLAEMAEIACCCSVSLGLLAFFAVPQRDGESQCRAKPERHRRPPRAPLSMSCCFV